MQSPAQYVVFPECRSPSAAAAATATAATAAVDTSRPVHERSRRRQLGLLVGQPLDDGQQAGRHLGGHVLKTSVGVVYPGT